MFVGGVSSSPSNLTVALFYFLSFSSLSFLLFTTKVTFAIVLPCVTRILCYALCHQMPDTQGIARMRSFFSLFFFSFSILIFPPPFLLSSSLRWEKVMCIGYDSLSFFAIGGERQKERERERERCACVCVGECVNSLRCHFSVPRVN